MSSRLKSALRLLALLLALGFLIALVAGQWQELRSYQWSIRPGPLLLSFLLLELAWLLELNIWRFILGSMGGRLRFLRAARTWFFSNLVRYIPGNIWQFLGMAELAADDGVSRITTLASVILHQALSTAAGLLLAALYFAAAGQAGPAMGWFEQLRPLLWLTPLGLILCQPRLLEWGLNQIMRLLKRPAIQVTLTWPQVWLLLLGYMLVWAIMGSGFAFLALALAPAGAATISFLPTLVAIWAAAYILGYLSMLTPAGLGVREGVMVLLLGTLYAAPAPTIIALAARLWMTAGELIGATVVALVGRVGHKVKAEAGIGKGLAEEGPA